MKKVFIATAMVFGFAGIAFAQETPASAQKVARKKTKLEAAAKPSLNKEEAATAATLTTAVPTAKTQAATMQTKAKAHAGAKANKQKAKAKAAVTAAAAKN